MASSSSDFDICIKYVSSLPKEGPIQLNKEQRLAFYKYFKIATVGDCNEPPCGILQFEAKAKQDAWKSANGTPPEEAKEKYVKLLNEINPNWKEDAAKMNITA